MGDMASWGNQRGGRGRMTQDEILAQENQLLTENLSSKVSHLKSLAFDMEEDAYASNRFIDGMNDDFSSSQGLLSGSMTRMSNMISTGKANRKLMCYIVLFLVGLFVLLYYVISKITSSWGSVSFVVTVIINHNILLLSVYIYIMLLYFVKHFE